MKTYLKQTTPLGGIAIIGFNHNTLEKVDIFEDKIVDIYQYDDIDDMNEAIQREFNRFDYQTEIITREEFISLASEFTNRYNNLIKEL